jgi:hypothetical protein
VDDPELRHRLGRGALDFITIHLGNRQAAGRILRLAAGDADGDPPLDRSRPHGHMDGG